MRSFPDGFRALVIGASGGIGQAFVQVLQANPRCAGVVALSRQSEPGIDFDDEVSVACWPSFRLGSAASKITAWAVGTATGLPRLRSTCS